MVANSGEYVVFGGVSVVPDSAKTRPIKIMTRPLLLCTVIPHRAV